jgi:thiamine-phosphate pyrophosphorylase
MDERLLAWGRAVKQRQHCKAPADRLPVLWLFTDAARLPDPLAAIARLPRGGLCGVVFRHDGVAGRADLAMQVARLCRKRGLPLVVAGDARLSARVNAGLHLRGGRWPDSRRPRQRQRSALVTSSAHDIAELRRAVSAGAEIIFLSPAFPTLTHAGSTALGAARWANIARRKVNAKIYSLGGVNGDNVHLLAGFCAGVGAISALNP